AKDASFVTFGGYENVPFSPKPTYSQQWNVSLEKQIGTNWLLSGNYVGTSIIHIWGGNQMNSAVFLGLGSCTLPGQATVTAVCSTTGNINNRRRLIVQNPAQGQYCGSLQQLDDGGTGSYEGMVLSVQRRQAKGRTVQASYTWSHCNSYLADPELAVAGQPYTIPGNRRYDRGNCATSD